MDFCSFPFLFLFFFFVSFFLIIPSHVSNICKGIPQSEATYLRVSFHFVYSSSTSSFSSSSSSSSSPLPLLLQPCSKELDVKVSNPIYDPQLEATYLRVFFFFFLLLLLLLPLSSSSSCFSSSSSSSSPSSSSYN